MLSQKNQSFILLFGVSVMFESIVVFHIDRSKSQIGSPIANQGDSIGAIDFRNYSSKFSMNISKLESWICSFRIIKPAKRIISKLFDWLIYMKEFMSDINLSKYFK
jgi:hypothetical protein